MSEQPFPISMVHPSRCHAPADNREVTPDDTRDLQASIVEHGILTPILLAPHPDFPDEYLVVDGARRVYCARILNVRVKAILLPNVPTEEEKIAIRLTVNRTRKDMAPAEVGADLYAYQAATNCTGDHLAQKFQMSPSMVSKLLAPFTSGVPELREALRERKIPLTAAPLIAKLPPDQQLEVIPKCLGQKRAFVEGLVKPLLGKKQPRQRQMKVALSKNVTLLFGCGREELRQAADLLLKALGKMEKEGFDISLLPQIIGR